MRSDYFVFWRGLLAAGLIGLLSACGGSSSDPAVDTAAPPPISGGETDNGTPPSGGGDADNDSNVLPRVYINTEGGAEVTSTDDYLNATVRIESENANEQLSVTTEIRGRGNTTWGMPKKPYRLKLEEAASMLGMPAERNWALLANYADKSLVRNKLAMELGEATGLAYNPRSVFIELYFNDAYQGVYEFFEHREVSPNRVNIPQLEETDTAPELITGGYFLEVDQRFDEDVCWFSSLQIPICAKDPELEQANIADPQSGSYAQYNYIVNYVNAIERSLIEGGDAYKQYLDVDSAVNWYLVEELTKNNDAQLESSVFLHKDRGGKMLFGPLWDFDLSSGNINYNGNDRTSGWWIRNSEWHSRLFANTDFGQQVFGKWCTLQRQGVISGLSDRVDAIVADIDPDAIARNFQRWEILGVNVGPNNFVGATHESEVEYLKSWLTERAAWMDAELTREYGACPAG